MNVPIESIAASRPIAQVLTVLAALILLVSAPAAPAAAQPVDNLRVLAKPVPFHSESADANGEDTGGLPAPAAGRLEYLGGLELTANSAEFGGFSGLHVTPDGRDLLAVSDRGYWWLARIYYEDGKLLDLGRHILSPALGADRRSLPPLLRDLEALAIDGDEVIIAREREHGLARYVFSHPGDLSSIVYSVPRAHPTPPLWRNMPSNGGIEAMVALGHSFLLVASEKAVNIDGTGKAWLIYDGLFQSLSLKLSQNFKPTDMALLPDGDVLVLQRRYNPFTGVAARLCIIERADLRPGTVMDCEMVAELKPPITVDNFEGLAVRQSPDGQTLVYLLSDNNFNEDQRTLLMMFRLLPQG